MNYASQAWIMILGPIAIFLVNGKTAKARMYGAIIGAVSGLGWYTQMWLHDQWLLLPMHLFYTAAWIRGIRNHYAIARASTDVSPAPARSFQD